MMTPFAIMGTVCEVGWEELHSCNNGGGAKETKCKITITTGVDTENKKDAIVKDTKTESRTEQETKTIDKTVTLEKISTLNLYAGGNANVGYSRSGLKGLKKKPRDKQKTTPTPVDGNGTSPMTPPKKGTASGNVGIGGGVGDNNEEKDEIVNQTQVFFALS